MADRKLEIERFPDELRARLRVLAIHRDQTLRELVIATLTAEADGAEPAPVPAKSPFSPPY